MKSLMVFVGVLVVGWWSGVLWFLFKALVVIAVFWLWVFFGFRNNCPNCGSSLEDEWGEGPISTMTVRDHCQCGWRRST